MVSDNEILGPPDKIETISSTLASKKTLVKKALGLTEYNFESVSIDSIICYGVTSVT